MSQNLIRNSIDAATVTTVLYQMASGELVKALLVPAVGYGMTQVGKYYKSDVINEIGESIIMTSLITIPGSAGGYAIARIGGKTLAIKAIAFAANVLGSYAILKKVAGFAGRAVVFAGCSRR